MNPYLKTRCLRTFLYSATLSVPVSTVGSESPNEGFL